MRMLNGFISWLKIDSGFVYLRWPKAYDAHSNTLVFSLSTKTLQVSLAPLGRVVSEGQSPV